MRTVRFAALAAAFTLVPLALAACGSSGSSPDEKDVTAVITRAATSGDPAACTDSQTQKFTDQTSGDSGPGAAAVKSCEQNAADSKSASVKVDNIKVSGSTATAEAALTGGTLDGQTVKLNLVKDGGKWKVDQVTGFVSFNADALKKSFATQLAKQAGTPAQIVSCLTQQVSQATDQQLENVFLTPNGGRDLFASCSGGQ
jgi:hypothetical protein